MHVMSIDAKRDCGFEREQVGGSKEGFGDRKEKERKGADGCTETYVAAARPYLKTVHASFQSGISRCSHTEISTATLILA